MAELDDADRIDEILASIGEHLVIEGAAGAETVRAGSPRPGWRRRLVVAAAAVAVVVAAVASTAPARRAVSGWLRAGNIDVEIDPDLTVDPALPGFVDEATPLDEAQLRDELGSRVPDVSASRLGRPHAWWSPPEPGILATWSDESTSLWVVRTEDTFPASLEKWAASTEAGTSLPDLGDGGFAVAGEHIFETEYRRIAAGSVVAWNNGGITFRLDSSMDVDELIAVAVAIAGGS